MPWPELLRPMHGVINPVALRAAGRVGALAVIEHVGRRSGTSYRTPVRAYRRGDVVAVGANFGAQSQWVRNVLAARGCTMTLRGRHLHLTDARLVPLADVPPVFPAWFRWGLANVVHTHHCVVLRVTGPDD